jgi:hypothetical protein
MSTKELKQAEQRLSNQYRALAYQQSRYLREGRDVAGTRQLMSDTWEQLKPVREELRKIGARIVDDLKPTSK